MSAENQGGGMPPKTVAIVSYLTLIGWVVALVVNSGNKSSLGSFHIRQMLGLCATLFALQIIAIVIPILGSIVALVGLLGLFVLWIMGIISASKEEETPVPVVGEYYQKWFSSL